MCVHVYEIETERERERDVQKLHEYLCINLHWLKRTILPSLIILTKHQLFDSLSWNNIYLWRLLLSMLHCLGALWWCCIQIYIYSKALLFHPYQKLHTQKHRIIENNWGIGSKQQHCANGEPYKRMEADLFQIQVNLSNVLIKWLNKNVHLNDKKSLTFMDLECRHPRSESSTTDAQKNAETTRLSKRIPTGRSILCNRLTNDGSGCSQGNLNHAADKVLSDTPHTFPLWLYNVAWMNENVGLIMLYLILSQ